MAAVLVVDDNVALGRALSRFLDLACGVEATFAAGGEAALAFVDDHPVSAVVLDLMMPGITGFEVLRRLRNGARTRALPVIVYSAMDEPAAVDEINRLGAQAFIKKGADVAEICQAVMRLKLQ